MKTPIEAHDHALKVVEELRKAGLGVSIRTCHMAKDAEIVKKYASDPTRVPAEKWCNVSFATAGDPDLAKLMYEKQDELRDLGMSFDSGGGMGGRDWELDFSFQFIPKA